MAKRRRVRTIKPIKDPFVDMSPVEKQLKQRNAWRGSGSAREKDWDDHSSVVAKYVDELSSGPEKRWKTDEASLNYREKYGDIRYMAKRQEDIIGTSQSKGNASAIRAFIYKELKENNVVNPEQLKRYMSNGASEKLRYHYDNTPDARIYTDGVIMPLRENEAYLSSMNKSSKGKRTKAPQKPQSGDPLVTTPDSKKKILIHSKGWTIPFKCLEMYGRLTPLN